MRITYLIGNGFDLNMGLQTSYSSFASTYVEEGEQCFSVNKLKESIKNYYKGDINAINWSDMEMGFGEFTGTFVDQKDGDVVLEQCHEHFCSALAQYLNQEEKRFIDKHIENDTKLIDRLGEAFLSVTKGLRPEDVDAINSYIGNIGGPYHVNVLTFNYTSILDIIKNELSVENRMGKRNFRNAWYINGMDDVIHVHGTTDHGMVFGVNDDSQLHPEVFTDEEPERKARLIKEDSNKMMGENTEGRATKAINSSDIIYIYGMSLGNTDKRWWERILELMRGKSQMILLIHSNDAPAIKRSAAPFVKYQRQMRNHFLSFLPELTTNQREGIRRRIFVTGGNIFSCLHDYTNAVHLPSSKKTVGNKK